MVLLAELVEEIPLVLLITSKPETRLLPPVSVMPTPVAPLTKGRTPVPEFGKVTCPWDVLSVCATASE